jgi:uncharacterized protein
MDPKQDNPAAPPTPWWRVGMVWLVLSGPAVVVVAGLVTLRIAMTHVDPVIQSPPAAHGAMAPAMKARNHAASPQQP